MLAANAKITVLGAGVAGLSTAVALARRGSRGRVRIVAERQSPNTTSDVAAASWYPYHVGDYDPGWARDSYRHFRMLLDVPAAGVTEVHGCEYFPRREDFDAWLAAAWWTGIDEVKFREFAPRGAFSRFVAAASFTIPVIHMPSYMKFLRERFLDPADCGGSIQTRRVERISDELQDCDALVNCSGLGARELDDVRDLSLTPCRGQVVSVRSQAAVHELVFLSCGAEYESEPLYVVPRGRHDVVLGSTAEMGDSDLSVREQTTQRIIARCQAVCPQLQSVEVLGVRVGLRPVRASGVRLELDRTGAFAKPVVHNYGHGGAGVTLSWGCAAHAARLLLDWAVEGSNL